MIMVVCFLILLLLLPIMYQLLTGKHCKGSPLSGPSVVVKCIMYVVFWGKVGLQHIIWYIFCPLCLKAISKLYTAILCNKCMLGDPF